MFFLLLPLHSLWQSVFCSHHSPQTSLANVPKSMDELWSFNGCIFQLYLTRHLFFKFFTSMTSPTTHSAGTLWPFIFCPFNEQFIFCPDLKRWGYSSVHAWPYASHAPVISFMLLVLTINNYSWFLNLFQLKCHIILYSTNLFQNNNSAKMDWSGEASWNIHMLLCYPPPQFIMLISDYHSIYNSLSSNNFISEVVRPLHALLAFSFPWTLIWHLYDSSVWDLKACTMKEERFTVRFTTLPFLVN